jgi:transketolase
MSSISVTTPTPTTEPGLDTVAELAAQLRVDSIRSSTSAGSGHPTSSMSAADLLAVLVARHLRFDWDDPKAAANDHLIFSKGHASPLLYSVFKAVGVVSEDELMSGYRRFGQRLQGHPTPILPWVDVATGSLGHGLPDGVGIALAGKYLERQPFRVWVLCGDSEFAEGSIWEALDKAAYYELSHLVAIVDVNRLGQRGATELGWDLNAYARRAEAFGARVLEIDGHDLGAIDDAFATAADTTGIRPTVILAKTVKGRGFSEVEDRSDWHGKPFPAEMAARAIAELGGVRDLVVRGPRPAPTAEDAAGAAPPDADAPLPRYAVGEAVATRKAYGDALVVLGARDARVVALDAEVSNSTYANEFARAYPERYFEMFIAEQQLVAAATGLSVRGYRPFASTFAAFFTRAHDFIRMAAVSGADLRLVGSHAGVEIGADGPSQMALEDLAMMRRTRVDGPVPERRHQRGGARRGDGVDGRHRLHAHDPRCLPGAVPGGGDLPDRRLEGAPVQRRGRRDPDRGRRHAARLPTRGGDAAARGNPRPRRRLLFDQAHRRRDARRSRGRHVRADRGRRGPPCRGRARLRCGRQPARRPSHEPVARAAGRARHAGVRVR